MKMALLGHLQCLDDLKLQSKNCWSFLVREIFACHGRQIQHLGVVVVSFLGLYNSTPKIQISKLQNSLYENRVILECIRVLDKI